MLHHLPARQTTRLLVNNSTGMCAHPDWEQQKLTTGSVYVAMIVDASSRYAMTVHTWYAVRSCASLTNMS